MGTKKGQRRKTARRAYEKKAKGKRKRKRTKGDIYWEAAADDLMKYLREHGLVK